MCGVLEVMCGVLEAMCVLMRHFASVLKMSLHLSIETSLQ